MKAIIVDRKINVAVVGCGRISKNHLDAIQKNADNLQLVALCDVDEIVLKEKCDEFDVAGYISLEEMLRAEQIDLAILATPSGLHSPQAIACAELGVHVLTEKPMATNWKDGLAMVNKFNSSSAELFVVKQNRNNPTLRLLKDALQRGRFGKIHLVNVNVFWTRPQAYYDQASWRGKWDLDGGALMNQASHYVDLLTWLIGPVDSVQAMASTYRDIEVEDTAVLNVKWTNGAIGSVSVTMLVHPKNYEASVTVFGSDGTACVGGVAANEILHWKFADELGEDIEVEKASYQTSSVYGFGHLKYYENLINVFRGTQSANTDGFEGLKSLEILEASYRAIKSEGLIKLPLEREED